MQTLTGDIWEQECDALCIPTNMIVKSNGHLVMGAGLARQAADRYPILSSSWGEYYYELNYIPKSHWDEFQVVTAQLFDEGPAIVSFPTKYDYRDMSSLPLIGQASRGLAKIADDRNWTNVLLPAVGCGLGGLKWERVEVVLDTFLDTRFSVIFPK